MNTLTEKLQAHVRLKFTRPLDHQEQFHLLHILTQLRHKDPLVIPSQVSDRFQHWNENFTDTEISFPTSDPSRVELRLLLSNVEALWREALWFLVRQMEAELRTPVRGHLVRSSVAATA